VPRFAIFLLSLLLLLPWASRAETPAHRPIVIGYVMDGATLPPIDARKLDAINFAFAHVNEHHGIFLRGDTATTALTRLNALKTDNPDLKLLLSVGGWGSGNFSEAAASEAARTTFAESAARLVVQHTLDGIDIDWEYPTLPGPGISHSPADRDNFTRMLQAVRDRLDTLGKADGRHYLLTIAAADGEAARGLDLPRIVPLLDWINLMTYDFFGSLTPTTGHHAALGKSAAVPADARTTIAAVNEFLAGGVPPAKLNVGAAFYGRKFVRVQRANHGLHQSYGEHAAFLSWRELQADYIDRNGYVRHWDEDAQAAWLWNEKDGSLVTYEDPQALRAKAAYVRERGLGGVMYWEHRQDDGTLLDAVRDGLYGP
jgi:chitinase